MEELVLPVFKLTPLPEKRIPWAVYDELNEELIRELKQSGEYERIRNNPMYRPAKVPFRLE